MFNQRRNLMFTTQCFQRAKISNTL